MITKNKIPLSVSAALAGAAPTVPTAPLPSELQAAVDRTDAALRVLPKKLGYANLELEQDWQTIRDHLLTMQRERDALISAKGVVIQPPAIQETEYISYLRKFIAQLQDDKCRCEMRIHVLREQLAASERTCAELRGLVQHNAMSAVSWQARAEAAERTVEGLRGKP